MQELLIIILIGVGLSMDAFSLALVYGTTGMPRRKIVATALTVGIYHFFMPIIGNYIGLLINSKVNIFPNQILGLIFIIIAIQMLTNRNKNDRIKILDRIGIIIFGLAVSIDSFSTGIGYGLLHKGIFLGAIMFSLISAIFTYIGLVIGKRLNHYFGKYATLAGALLLVIISAYYLTK